MKKIKRGILFGCLAGLIDVTPMIMMKLSWDANLSAFSFWVITGLIISTSNLKLNGWKKGLILALLLQVPILIIVAGENINNLLIILPFTIVLGSLLGKFIEKK